MWVREIYLYAEVRLHVIRYCPQVRVHEIRFFARVWVREMRFFARVQVRVLHFYTQELVTRSVKLPVNTMHINPFSPGKKLSYFYDF